MTTDELIETLERLEKEATPRPWVSEWDADDDVEGPYMVGGCIKAGGVDLFEASDGCRAKDLDAVAEIRNHLPALISAIKENKRMREGWSDAMKQAALHIAGASVAVNHLPELKTPNDLAAYLMMRDLRMAEEIAALQPQGDAKP